MSYRDEATLSFDGAALWMLCGANGAGKSTVFDAMKFALFGTHRGGAQGADALIHHDSDKLKIEFDFQIEDDIYRVQRTLSRRNKSSFQALHISGPHAPRVGMPSPQAIPETESKSGLTRWVGEHLGLNEETFSAAILLQQGKSDALLSADNETRFQMLAQIVDLESYQKVHEVAEERRKNFNGNANLLRSQLDAAPGIDAAALEAISQTLQTLARERDELQNRRDENLGLQPQARHWQRLQGQRVALEKRLRQAEQLLQRAEIIEREANRLDELKSVLPSLEYSRDERDQMQLALAREKQCRESAKSGEEKIGEKKKTCDQLKDEIAEQRENQSQWNEARELANTRLRELAPVLQATRDIEKLQAEIKDLDVEIEKFAPDLDHQIETEQGKVSASRGAQAALSPLSRLANAREKRFGAQREYSRSHQEWQAACSEHEKLKAEYSSAQKTQTENENVLQAARDDATQKKTLLQQIRAQMARFQEVENDAACHYCGQKLTPDHRARESERLQNEATNAIQNEKTARNRCDAAAKIQIESAQNEQRLKERIEALHEIARDAKERKKFFQREIETALQNALNAWRELPEEFAVRAMENIAQNENDETSRVEAVLESGQYPAPDDLNAIQKSAKNLAAREKEVENLQSEKQERATKTALMEKVAARLNGLQREYSLARREQAQRDDGESKEQLKIAGEQLKMIANEIARKNSSLQTATKELLELEKTQREFLDEAVRLAASLKANARALEKTKSQLDEKWQSVFENIVREKIASLQNEKSELEKSGASKQREELQTAREQENLWREQAEHVARESEEIPAAARRDISELQDEAEKIKAELQEKSSQHALAQSEYSGLDAHRAQREKLAEQLDVAETGARRHKLLADALGRDGLQRRLLREAENIITDAANGVLDRISGGTLRLQLKTEEESGAARGKAKALDLVAYNSLSSDAQNATALPFLSGSQRFRVAVALALGIGHYATQGAARRAEAVIIDEGFGSLDKQGLREMIEELHGLQSVLKRVILVSHQDEFAHSFSNRYLIELENGTSRATLQQATGEELLA